MGKMPVVGLVGLFWVGVTLSGCTPMRNKDGATTYQPKSTFGGQVSATGANGAASANVAGATGAGGTAVGGNASGAFNTPAGGVTANTGAAFNSATGAGGVSGGLGASGVNPAGDGVKVSGEGSWRTGAQNGIPTGAAGLTSGSASATPGANAAWGGGPAANSGVTSPGALTTTSNMRTTDLGANPGSGGLDANTGGPTAGGIQRTGYAQDNPGATGSSGTTGGFDRLPTPAPTGRNARSGQTDNLGGDGNMMPRASASSGLDAPGGRYGVPLPPPTSAGSMAPGSGLTPPAQTSVKVGDPSKPASASSPTYEVPSPTPGAALPEISSGAGSGLVPGTGAGASGPPADVTPPATTSPSPGVTGPSGATGATGGPFRPWESK